MLKEKDILNVEKKDNLYNIELNKSSNGYKFFTTPWENIPRYDSKGNLMDPEDFKEMIIQKNGLVFFNQNYACVSGDTVVNVYDDREYKISIRELYHKFKDFTSNLKILTQSGYSTFAGVRQITKETLKISFETSEITVTPDHRFVVNKQEIFAKDLKVGDFLQSTNDLVKITNITKDKTQSVYDVLETEDHTYITNDIISHNCEFIGSSYTLLSAEKLKSLVSEEPKEIRDGKLKIYEYPKEKHQYIMSVDPAKDGIDAFAVQVIDITDIVFKQVASAKLQVDYLIMPEWLNSWGIMYNNAYMIIENNEGAGQSVADTLYNSYSYGNLFFEKKMSDNKRKKYPGFRTTVGNRGLLLNTLRLFSDNNKLEIHDSSTIKELFTFALINNKYQAQEGCHDDMVMSLALAFAPFTNAKNFDDITQLTKQIYNRNDDSPSNEQYKNLAQLLTNASFDDFGDDQVQERSVFDNDYFDPFGTLPSEL